MALCAWFGPPPAEAREPNHFVSEIQLFLADHPRLLARGKMDEAAEEDIGAAFSNYLPRVDLTADYGVDHISSPTQRYNAPFHPYTHPRKTVGATLTQNLFAGSGNALTQGNVTMAEYGHAASLAETESVRQGALYEATAAYLDVLRQYRLLEVARRNEATIKRQLDLEDERVRRGSGIAVDVLDAKSRLQLAKERRVGYQGTLAAAQARYVQYFGRPSEVGEMTLPNLPLGLIPDSVDKAVEVALVENPGIVMMGQTTKRTDEGRDAAARDYYPNVDLELSWDYEDDKEGVRNHSREWSILVKARWNIFNGFKTDATVARAAHMHGAAVYGLQETQRTVAEQTRVAWHTMMAQRERVDLVENAANIAAEVFESRKRLLDAGRAEVIDVLDSEAAMANAELATVEAEFNKHLATYQLLLAMGRLTEEGLIAAN
ncbi:TolC family protein [Roseospirillum parvum]|uniref:TolC family protein n=1 Tax=Roseospirillum parvum TaxID=83401 RepID=UPI001C40A910|nr:TolC family protein [Roseospirillum parvum]